MNIPRISEEETAKQLVMAKTGTPEERRKAIDILILGHVGLASSIAARYAARVPSKGEDILAYALYLLVDLTNRIADGELMTLHCNYDAYINFVLQKEIERYLNQDYTIRPHTNDPKVLDEEIRTDPEGFKDRFTPRPLTECKAVSPSADRNFDLLVDDVVNGSCMFSMMEKEVIFGRIEGLQDIEIAAQMRISKQRVGQIKENMRKKLEDLTGETS